MVQKTLIPLNLFPKQREISRPVVRWCALDLVGVRAMPDPQYKY